MSSIEEAIWCKNCGVEISWGPVVFGKYVFCCQDCLQGVGCECGQLMEQEEERQKSGDDLIIGAIRRLG